MVEVLRITLEEVREDIVDASSSLKSLWKRVVGGEHEHSTPNQQTITVRGEWRTLTFCGRLAVAERILKMCAWALLSM